MRLGPLTEQNPTLAESWAAEGAGSALHQPDERLDAAGRKRRTTTTQTLASATDSGPGSMPVASLLKPTPRLTQPEA